MKNPKRSSLVHREVHFQPVTEYAKHIVAAVWTLAVVLNTGHAAAGTAVRDYPSLQAALDANPGRMIEIPDGDYPITEALRIRGSGGGLYGFGRIVQTNPKAPVLHIEDAEDIRILSLTLVRPEEASEAEANGIRCERSRRIVFDGLRMVDCRAREAVIELSRCEQCTVRNVEIRNYQRIAVDDRTGPSHELYGYAFICIDGTGILAQRCVGTVIENNRIVESRMLPTKDMKERHKLGSLTEGQYPSKPGTLGESVFKQRYANNWHQGSAIVVTAPENSRQTIVRGNVIQNAAQGIDLHCDEALVEGNMIDCCMIGVKGTHGCRNLNIVNNLIARADLWGILLNPGAVSHEAEPARNGQPARPANEDAGTIIANNIITDYGYGNEYWNFGGSYAIALYEGQLDTNPPLRDILVTGNMVYDTGRDAPIMDGQSPKEPPRYRYAVYVGPWGEDRKKGPTFPQNIHFANNIFHPGTKGVSNIEFYNR